MWPYETVGMIVLVAVVVERNAAVGYIPAPARPPSRQPPPPPCGVAPGRRLTFLPRLAFRSGCRGGWSFRTGQSRTRST